LTRINSLGIDESDVTTSVANAIAGTSQTAPVYWLNTQNGVTYPLVAQTPEYMIDSFDELEELPVTPHDPTRPSQILGALGTFSRGRSNAEITQYNIQPVVDVYAGYQGRDLGAVAADVSKILQRLDKDRPETIKVVFRGQVETMNTAFTGMGFGLLGA